MNARPSEDDLIARYLAPLAGRQAFALRDDAALATPRLGCDLVVSKDMLVAGRHFFPDDPPDAIARKALRVNLSDLAAKGADPLGFLLGLALPDDWTEPWLAAFCAGLGEDAAAFGCPLLGGDTVATPGPLTLSVSVFGEVPAGGMVPRGGTRVGDRIYVTGMIGDAALGLQLRRNRAEDRAWTAALGAADRTALLDRYLRPQPRLALRDALLAHARSAMDVSDGFLGDLAKMLRLEGLGASVALADVPLSPAVCAALVLDPRLAEAALTGGDDYEILCAVPPSSAPAFEAAGRAGGVALACVGVATTGEGVSLRGIDGAPLPLPRGSFQHFG